MSNPPKFDCSDVYFGPVRKALEGKVTTDRKQMFEERSGIQQQVHVTSM